MVCLRYISTFLLLSALCLSLLTSCESFTSMQPQVKSSTLFSSRGRIQNPLFSLSPLSSCCHHRRQHRQQSLYMTDDSSNDSEDSAKMEASEVAAGSSSSENTEDKSAEEETRGIAKTILLVPLFCKFVVVLLIKFITDLIVFPLLFIYRLVGIGKRRFLKMIGKGGSEINGKQNGET